MVVVIRRAVGAGNPPVVARRVARNRGVAKTKNLTLKKTIKSNDKQPLPINFEKGSKGTYIAVGTNSDSFNRLSGTMVSRIPPYYPAWKQVPPEHTCTIWDELQSYFKMDDHLEGPDAQKVKVGLNKYFAGLYCSQKFKFSKRYFEARGGLERAEQLRENPPADLPMRAEEWQKFVDFKTSQAFQRRSRANKECRAKLDIISRHGRKNQAQIRHDNPDVSPIELWRRRRTKGGQFTEPRAARLYDQMMEKVNDPSCTLNEFQIMEEVLGESRSWYRGFGQRLPQSALHQPSTSQASTSQASTSQATFTAEDVRRMLAEYTAPLWQKMNMQPPPMPFPIQEPAQEPAKEPAPEEEDDDSDDTEG